MAWATKFPKLTRKLLLFPGTLHEIFPSVTQIWFTYYLKAHNSASDSKLSWFKLMNSCFRLPFALPSTISARKCLQKLSIFLRSASFYMLSIPYINYFSSLLQPHSLFISLRPISMHTFTTCTLSWYMVIKKLHLKIQYMLSDPLKWYWHHKKLTKHQDEPTYQAAIVHFRQSGGWYKESLFFITALFAVSQFHNLCFVEDKNNHSSFTISKKSCWIWHAKEITTLTQHIVRYIHNECILEANVPPQIVIKAAEKVKRNI